MLFINTIQHLTRYSKIDLAYCSCNKCLTAATERTHMSNVITFSTHSNVSNMINRAVLPHTHDRKSGSGAGDCGIIKIPLLAACVAQSLQRPRSAPTTLGPALLHTTVTLIIASMNMISSWVLSRLFPPSVEVKTICPKILRLNLASSSYAFVLNRPLSTSSGQNLYILHL